MEQIINRLLDDIEALKFQNESLKNDVRCLERQKEIYEEDVYLFKQFLSEQNIKIQRLDKYFLIKREDEEEENGKE